MIDESHPEATCDDCYGPNIVWFADNHLWNLVMENREAIVCPVCFVMRAEAMGLTDKAWRLSQEDKKCRKLVADAISHATLCVLQEGHDGSCSDGTENGRRAKII